MTCNIIYLIAPFIRMRKREIYSCANLIPTCMSICLPIVDVDSTKWSSFKANFGVKKLSY